MEVVEIDESAAEEKFDPKLCQMRILSHGNCEKDTLVFHIHGGGYVLMSTFIHQNVTRMLAIEIERAVIVCPEYRKAPDNSFPDAFEDVWQAYFWMVVHCKSFLGFEPRRIILTGDSAGGKFAITIPTMAIQRGFRVPDGTVPFYCPSSLTVAEFHPSLLFSLDDVALRQGLVIAIGPAYLPKQDFYDPRVDKSEYM